MTEKPKKPFVFYYLMFSLASIYLFFLVCIIFSFFFRCEPYIPRLSFDAAKAAIADYIKKHPDTFSSPGGKEEYDKIIKEKELSTNKDIFFIGRFSVNPNEKSYQLMHSYGKIGSGFFESWVWMGKFKLTNCKWEITEPEFIKKWGK